MSTELVPTALMARPNSGGAVRDFLTEASASGSLSVATANALRTALTTVLQAIEGDNWADFDMADADEDQVFKRFTNRTGNKYTAATQRAYKLRFHQARAMYLAREAGDPDWVQVGRATRERTAKAKQSNPVRSGRSSRRADAAEVAAPGAAAPVSAALTTETGLLTVPFAVRPGLRGQLTLPEDLTATEASRLAKTLANLVAAMAFEDATADEAASLAEEP